MPSWKHSNEAADFIATADSRETSKSIMEAIAFFARNKAEAEALWSCEGFGKVCYPIDFWERVTGNGKRETNEFIWGARGGRDWWSHIRNL